MKTISNYRLEEIIATITELSKGKKRDLYNFLINLKSNKVIFINSQSTDKQYPSAKCVYDIVGNIESVLDNILGN